MTYQYNLYMVPLLENILYLLYWGLITKEKHHISPRHTPYLWNTVNSLFSSTHQCRNQGEITAKGIACLWQKKLKMFFGMLENYPVVYYHKRFGEKQNKTSKTPTSPINANIFRVILTYSLSFRVHWA